MPIKVKCPNQECGKFLTVGDQFAGKTGKCPACGSPVKIPVVGANSAETAQAKKPGVKAVSAAPKPVKATKPASDEGIILKAKALPPEPEDEVVDEPDEVVEEPDEVEETVSAKSAKARALTKKPKQEPLDEPEEVEDEIDELDEIEDEDDEEEDTKKSRKQKKPKKSDTKATQNLEKHRRKVGRYGDWAKVRQGIVFELVGLLGLPVLGIISFVIWTMVATSSRQVQTIAITGTVLFLLNSAFFVSCITRAYTRCTDMPSSCALKGFGLTSAILMLISAVAYITAVFCIVIAFLTAMASRDPTSSGIIAFLSLIAAWGSACFLSLAMTGHLGYWICVGFYFRNNLIKYLAIGVGAGNLFSWLISLVGGFSREAQPIFGCTAMVVGIPALIAYFVLLFYTRIFLSKYA